MNESACVALPFLFWFYVFAWVSLFLGISAHHGNVVLYIYM